MHYNRLPHIDNCHNYQFITFRTIDSVDDFLRRLFVQNLSNDKMQHAVDKYADTSIKGAYLKDDTLVLLFDFLKSKDPGYYDLIAFSIMPNHVHLLVKPNIPLSKLMQLIKGGSAKLINDLLNKQGHFWFKNYYDKGIRDQAHFDCVYRYIENNPLKLSLSQQSMRFYGIYGSD
ncbi:MAG: transposase [Methylococcaceae bacterium]